MITRGRTPATPVGSHGYGQRSCLHLPVLERPWSAGASRMSASRSPRGWMFFGVVSVCFVCLFVLPVFSSSSCFSFHLFLLFFVSGVFRVSKPWFPSCEQRHAEAGSHTFRGSPKETGIKNWANTHAIVSCVRIQPTTVGKTEGSTKWLNMSKKRPLPNIGVMLAPL